MQLLYSPVWELPLHSNFIVDGLKVESRQYVAVAFKSFKGEIGMEVYPALLGVGYIVGPRIASFMFVGSIVGCW